MAGKIPTQAELRLAIGNRADIRAVRYKVNRYLDEGVWRVDKSDLASFMNAALDVVRSTAGGSGRNSWPISDDNEEQHSVDLFNWNVYQGGELFSAEEASRGSFNRTFRRRLARRSPYYMVGNETPYAAGVEQGYVRRSDGYLRPRSKGGYLRRLFNALKSRDSQRIERHMALRIKAMIASEAKEAQATLRGN